MITAYVFKRCHFAVYICSNLCIISKHIFLVFPFCFGGIRLAAVVFKAPPFCPGLKNLS